MWESIQLNTHRFIRISTEALAEYWLVAVPAAFVIAVAGYFLFRSRLLRALAISLSGLVWVEEVHDFVVLIEAARADPEFREEVVGILQMAPFHRRSLLNDLISAMQFRGAPQDFVQAVALLKDDRVAERALLLIREI